MGEGYGYDKIILLRDLNQRAESDVQREFEWIHNGLPSELRGRVSHAVARREIEAWFLADPETIKQITGHEARIPDSEAIDKPAKELAYIFRKCGKEYLKGSAFPVRLARAMDLSKAIDRSQSLKRFISLARN